MSFSDCLTLATRHAFDHDQDMPEFLLGNIIVSEAALRAGFDSDRMGCADHH